MSWIIHLCKMKLLLSIFFLAVCSTLFSQSLPVDSSRTNSALMDCLSGYGPTGEPYPEFTLENETRKVTNQSLKGKVVLINFWFEGCHPCMAEMDALQTLYKRMKSYKDFEFISITWDNKETIKRVKDKFGLSFEVFQASQPECTRLNLACGYPTSLIIDKSGILRYRHHGGSTKIPEAAAFVENTLATEIESLR